MSSRVFKKMLFLAVLMLFACLLSVSASANVWQSGSTEDSVTVAWSDPPETEKYYGDDDWVHNFLYNSNLNAQYDLFDDIKEPVPVYSVVSITVTWEQDGAQKQAVIPATNRSYTITDLSSYSAYDVAVTYKFREKESDDQWHTGTLGSTVASTDAPEGKAENFQLYAGHTYNASELGYGRYAVGRNEDQTICTINMDRDLSINTLYIGDGCTLVLKGSGTLKVKAYIRCSRSSTGLGSGNLDIRDQVSVYVPQIYANNLLIDTTGSVVLNPIWFLGANPPDSGNSWPIKDGEYVYGGIDLRGMMTVSNGTVILKSDSEPLTEMIRCYDFMMTGGHVFIRDCEWGLDVHGSFYVLQGSEDRDVYLSIMATEGAAVRFSPVGSGTTVRIGDLYVDPPVELTTPAGGSVKFVPYHITEPEYDTELKVIADAGGNMATHVVFSIPLTYTVEASLDNSSIPAGETAQMKYETKASNASEVTGSIYSFSSDDETIATVDSDGVVKGIAPGKTKITVVDMTHGSASAEVEITVTEPEPDPTAEDPWSWEIIRRDGAPEVTGINLEQVARALLAENQVPEDAKAKVWMEISPLNEAVIPAAEVQEVRKTLEELGAAAGQWFDISMFMQVNERERQAVHRTPSEFVYIVKIPEELKKPGRTYYLIRIHDGVVTVITVTEEDLLSGQTDRFSPYLIAYRDAEGSAPTAAPTATPTPASTMTPTQTSAPRTVPKTGDSNHPVLWLGMICLGMAGLAAVAALKVSRKRK